MFCIAKFVDENDSVAVIPRAWILEGGSCIWPRYGKDKLKAAIKNSEMPKNLKDWKNCKAEIIKEFDSYAAAREKLKKSTETSELSDTEEETNNLHHLRQRSYRPMKHNALTVKHLTPIPKLLNYTVFSEESVTEVEKDLEVPSTSEELRNDALRTYMSTINEHTTGDGNEDVSEITIPMCNPVTNEMSDFSSKILEYLADVKLKLDRLECKVDLLTKSQSVNSYLDEEGFDELPFSDPKQLMGFKRQIEGSKTFKLKVIDRFSSFGGRKASLHVNAILSDLMTDELAKSYSLCGLRGNRNFSELGFLKIIYVSVKKTAKNSTLLTREEVRSSVDSWLRHANDRLTSKFKKQSARTEVNSSSSDESE